MPVGLIGSRRGFLAEYLSRTWWLSSIKTDERGCFSERKRRRLWAGEGCAIKPFGGGAINYEAAVVVCKLISGRMVKGRI